MRWRQVIFLWAVLATLAVGYWSIEPAPEPPPGGRPARQRFLAVESGALMEVRLHRDGRTIVSRRAGDRWAVVEPEGAPIPSDLIAAFTNALVEAEEIARVETELADPKAYGLGQGAAQVEILTGTGPPLAVTIGAPNPTGTAVYARRGGEQAIVLIGRNVRYYEDLLFESLPAARVPAGDGGIPVGG
jgi:Domain of unknown function (DUF4340)